MTVVGGGLAAGTPGCGPVLAGAPRVQVDLNCDLGESFGAYRIGDDGAVVPYVTSANVACGMHAGDPLVMLETVRLAVDHGVAVGAHPGYPDLQGFGRRDLALSPDEIYAYVLYQVGSLDAFCRTAGTRLHHVKPHGQLYNRAAVDRAAAEAVACAVRDFDATLVLVGLANSELVDAGHACGLRCAEEFFADRAYTGKGLLVPRSCPGAVVANVGAAVARTVRAVRDGLVTSIDGDDVHVRADTVCVHGDNAHAVAFARRLHSALTEAGVEVAAP